MRRLLRIRELQEQQSQTALKVAVSRLNQLNIALTAAEERARKGRRMVGESMRNSNLSDRLAGIEEQHSAARAGDVLSGWIAAAEANVSESRANHLRSSIERRQSETLVTQIQSRDARENARRNQRELDDWFRSRS
jgi:hypothetical protein